jgi:hypothetical protein
MQTRYAVNKVSMGLRFSTEKNPHRFFDLSMFFFDRMTIMTNIDLSGAQGGKKKKKIRFSSSQAHEHTTNHELERSMQEQAAEFFKACETGKGWAACSAYCTPDATFAAQSEPLLGIKTLEAYTDWMKGLAKVTMPGCSYELKATGWDAERRAAVYYATFKGTHSGPGPTPEPTGKSTVSDHVYVMFFNQDSKIHHMTTVWNAPYAMKELGWA